MNYEMTTAIYELMNTIKNDYYTSMTRNYREELTEHRAQMCDEFNASVRFEEGRKYVKVIAGRSVWGFIMKDDDAKFKAGDILMAASWATPARNKARGNIFGQYSIAWTGPAYL